MRAVLFSIIFSYSFLCAGYVGTEKEFISKISSLITVGDHKGARRVSFLTKELYPNSDGVLSLYIRSLANDGYLKEALNLLPPILGAQDISKHFSVLEAIGWNFLLHEEGISSVSNIASLLGAYRTQDARCVHLLLKKLDSTNAYDRHLAVKLSMSYRDLPLRKKILQMLQVEKNYFVKLMLLEAAGSMEIKEAEGILRKVVASSSKTPDERGVAIKSLVSLSDKPQKKELQQLQKSHNTSMRELCVSLITHFEMKEYADMLIGFISDRHPKVRAKAMLGLILLDVDKKQILPLLPKIESLIEKDVVDVSVIASILLLSIDQEKGLAVFARNLLSKEKERARFASRVIGHIGKVAHPLILDAYHKSSDPMVQANLSIAMLGKDIDDYTAVKYLSRFLKEYSSKIMIRGEYAPLFMGIDESKVRHIPYIQNYPNLVDSMTRLQLLSKLSILEVDGVEDSLRSFLKNRMWKVSSSAAILMLEESSLDDFDALKQLLKDEDATVRLQAALVLAFHGNDKTTCRVLEEIYDKVDWEKRIMILEAIGVIGDKGSVPFILEKMKKESFILQKMAAATLLQCLYH